MRNGHPSTIYRAALLLAFLPLSRAWPEVSGSCNGPASGEHHAEVGGFGVAGGYSIKFSLKDPAEEDALRAARISVDLKPVADPTRLREQKIPPTDRPPCERPIDCNCSSILFACRFPHELIDRVIRAARDCDSANRRVPPCAKVLDLLSKTCLIEVARNPAGELGHGLFHWISDKGWKHTSLNIPFPKHLFFQVVVTATALPRKHPDESAAKLSMMPGARRIHRR